MKTAPGLIRVTAATLFSLAGLTLACGSARFDATREIMGTYLKVTVMGARGSPAQGAADAAIAAVAHLDSVLSIYKPGSDFSRLNRAAGAETVTVSTEAMEVLEASRRFWAVTVGAFDPSVGPLMRLWKLQGEGNVPRAEEIDSTLAFVGFDKVYLDPPTRRVFLPAGMRLDPGGIGKGYAADVARAELARRGIRRSMVDLGGNVAVMGAGPTRGHWAIGIRNPLERDQIIGSIDVTDAAVATSGQYEQYFVRDGIRYGHILDPRTGRPASGMLSATIIAPDATTTDGLSTGVFVLGPERGMALVEKLAGVEAVVVLDPGVDRPLTRADVRVSSGLRGRIRWAIP